MQKSMRQYKISFLPTQVLTKFTQHLDSSKNALMNAIKKIAGLGPI